jgi:polysaccharide deacetylase 2 family uncharacterized protein YibQ
VTTDDLSKPLGQTKPRKSRRRLPFSGLQVVTTALAMFLLAFAGFVFFKDDPLGGEPAVRLALDATGTTDKTAQAPASGSSPVATTTSKPASTPAAPGETRTITIIDGSSGARQEVKVSATSPDAQLGSGLPTEASASPVMMAGINPTLLESSRYGMIPVATSGLTPAKVYARGGEAERARAATMPAIAIVINGLGIGAAKTNDAIIKLPGAVTLAFTPYGADPAKLVERARTEGHEVFLQVPMEPFDYPDNDPGPQTLLTSLTPEQNLDRLYWHLSRFQGYAGLTNFMGSRFVATDAAMQPVVKEAGKRGLAWFDDGAAARSVAGHIADSNSMAFNQADLTIDAVPTASDIDRALAQLETLARQRGVAVGVASALPISIDRIGSWIKTLESRGIVLVPLTMAMQKSKS